MNGYTQYKTQQITCDQGKHMLSMSETAYEIIHDFTWIQMALYENMEYTIYIIIRMV